jgi:hypothetical protein
MDTLMRLSVISIRILYMLLIKRSNKGEEKVRYSEQSENNNKYHKAEYLPCLRNVLAIQAGTLCGQTPFMRRKSIAAHIGFWIVEFGLGKEINRFKCEFFAQYER